MEPWGRSEPGPPGSPASPAFYKSKSVASEKSEAGNGIEGLKVQQTWRNGHHQELDHFSQHGQHRKCFWSCLFTR